MELLFTDDTESERPPFDTTTLLLGGINGAKHCCNIHDNRNRKNMVPFLKSNYKYKRRVPQFSSEHVTAQVNYLLRPRKQVEVERIRHLTPTPPLSDSYFEAVVVGFIVSAVVVFSYNLLNLFERVVRESRRVWCKKSNKMFCRLSEMFVEVKRFTLDCWRLRFGVTTAAATVGYSKSFGLQYVSASLKLIYLTLFIAFWMTACEVEAGTCWMERMDNGKCETVYSKNMTKAQCCGKNQMFSYTEKNLSNVEYFFALALGGGTECVPCLESCKDVVCGPNKRCVKRKGRPKCICSPQCGSGKKNKKSHKRKQQQQHIHQQNGSLKPPHVIDISRSKEHLSLVNFHSSPITVRDIRSLSSEIQNNPSAVSAMELTSPGDHISQSNSRRKNQRISISSNPTKNQASQHRLHHHHHNHNHKHDQEQQHHTPKVPRRRHANTNRNKADQMIITADDLVHPSTERDNEFAESNSLRVKTSTTSADTHQLHQQQKHGRHNYKKHTKPKHKITEQNGVTNNSVHHNGTVPKTTTMMTATTSAYRNKMKIAERHRIQSFEGLQASFASSPLDSEFKRRKPMTLFNPSNSNNNKELHLGQDYTDDLTFDDKIHNGFFTNGFPYPHQEISTDEGRHTHPVCGSDGRTYNTECQLKKRACRTDNTALVVAYRGHCQTSCKKVNCLNGLQCVEDHYAIPHCIVCSIKCPIDDNTQQIDPARAVCGVDGNTYKSTCDINRMVCKIGRSIAVAYPGPCREERTSCENLSCGPKMTCLTDLMTHRPRCVSCKFKCSRKRHPSNLRYEEGKMCGNNNRTYYSWCEMKKDSCQTGFFIDIKSIGECQQQI